MRWVDAFPWLAELDGRSELGWLHQPVDQTEPDFRSSRASTLAILAMYQMEERTIREILPLLSPNLDLTAVNLPVRAINALGRVGVRTSDQLLQMKLRDILDLRNVGVLTVEHTLRTLFEVVVSGFRTEPDWISRSIPRKLIDLFWDMGEPEADQPSTPEWLEVVRDDLTLVARWQAQIGRADQPLLDPDALSGAPVEVADALDRIMGLSAAQVLPDREVAMDIADVLGSRFRELDEREFSIAWRRIFSDEPMTLEQLGDEAGVSRERVRQIEKQTREVLRGWVDEPGPIADVAASTRAFMGSVRPLEDLLRRIPALQSSVESLGQPAWRVFDVLDDDYEIVDGWCVTPSMKQARNDTEKALADLVDDHGVTPLDEIHLVDSDNPSRRRELTIAWLRYCGYQLYRDHVLTRTSSVGDYAAGILAVEQIPLGSEDIVGRFAFERSASSLRNMLALDDRFTRVDRDSWGLSEWGLDAYEGIRPLIGRLIEEAGGTIRLDELVSEVTGRFTVSPSSVITYANAPPYLTRRGVVQMAGRRRAHRSPKETGRLFRRDRDWVYRVQIGSEHIRGSGSVAPMGVAEVVQLFPGESVELSSRLGKQTITWKGSQLAFGSIQRFVRDMGLLEGDEVFLAMGDDRSFSVERVAARTGEPLRDALALVGADPNLSGETARRILARAVGLAYDATPESIVDRCRMRDDADLVELLTAAWSLDD